MPGQTPFTAEQNGALRAELRRLRDERGLNTTQLGALLGIGQQAASRIVSSDGGMSYPSALAVAMEAGHDSLEHFFIAHGVPTKMAGAMTVDDDPYQNRRDAVRLARRMGADEEAIKAARSMRGDGAEAYALRTWVEMIMRHSDDVLRKRQATAAAREERKTKRDPKRRHRAA